MRERAFVSEIAADTYRITTYHEPWRSTVNQYLVVDDEPTLISTGLRERFEDTWAGLAQVIDPARLRYVVVPHFEADECGALNDLLLRAPNATPLASMRTVITSLADVAVRSPRGVGDGEVIDTGAHGLRMLEAPYVHAWDGIVIVDEHTQVAFTRRSLHAARARRGRRARRSLRALGAALQDVLRRAARGVPAARARSHRVGAADGARRPVTVRRSPAISCRTIAPIARSRASSAARAASRRPRRRSVVAARRSSTSAVQRRRVTARRTFRAREAELSSRAMPSRRAPRFDVRSRRPPSRSLAAVFAIHRHRGLRHLVSSRGRPPDARDLDLAREPTRSR